MRRNIASKFDRWWQDLEPWSVVRVILAPIIGAIFIVKMFLTGIFVLVVLYQIARFPSAWNRVVRAFREAEALGQTDHDSTRLKGGEHGNVGDERRGFLVRSGGPLNSDDLRRRLYELRASQQERKHKRTPNKGGQNG